jgi:hypothetical protein
MRRFLFILLTTTLLLCSCVGTRLKKQKGHSVVEVANKLGEPVVVATNQNGERIWVYFYQDYSPNHYPSIVGLMYINQNNIVYRVEKEKTRLTLSSYLRLKQISIE